jgi:hypothetical protein
MDPKIVDLLEKLGAQIDAKGAQAFEIAVRGVYVEAVAAMYWVGLAVVFMLIFGYVSYRAFLLANAYKPTGYHDDGALPYYVVAVLSGIFSIISFLVGITYLGYVPQLMAPEWAALKQLAAFIK